MDKHEEFCVWLKGYIDITGNRTAPTSDEWKVIKDKLLSMYAAQQTTILPSFGPQPPYPPPPFNPPPPLHQRFVSPTASPPLGGLYPAVTASLPSLGNAAGPTTRGIGGDAGAMAEENKSLDPIANWEEWNNKHKLTLRNGEKELTSPYVAAVREIAKDNEK